MTTKVPFRNIKQTTMGKKIILYVSGIVLASLLCIQSQQQNPTASFDVETHNFGIIKEADGAATYRFVFTNTGGTPLKLNNVTASCGCTTPAWSKEPVLPGAKGYIAVTYNTRGRPGKFEKQITVTSNGDPETQVLFIEGEVIPKEPSLEEQYPNNIEGLRLKLFEFDFGDIAPNKKSVVTMEVLNSTDQPVKVSFANTPKYLNVKIMPETIKSKAKATIQVEYDAALKKDWGTVRDYIKLKISGKDSLTNRRIPIKANIKEDFSKLSEEQRNNAPKVIFENTNYNFGDIKSGEKATHDFNFKNEGKSDLIIRKIQTSCGCTAANPKSNTIKPGESSLISVVFNSTGRTGNQNKQITLVTNDPVNSEITLKITGTVK
jgi:hypothetical protein